jgi:hypothetical protein
MIVIVSPSSIGGVRDYAEQLCSELNGRGHACRVSFGRRGDALAKPGDDVLLQYSGYGFEKRGAPGWLLREVRAQRTAWRSFGVYFHELYAFGPPWSSAFWLTIAQRRIARGLLRLSDYWFCNRSASAEWLNGVRFCSSGGVMNICSTVGEPRPDAFASKRGSDAVVFGSAGIRLETYEALKVEGLSALKQSGILIHDVGPPIASSFWSRVLRNHEVVEHGKLGLIQLHRLLGSSSHGLLAYPKAFIAKSSVFAAYCAFGLTPVLFSNEHPESDGLARSRHYLAEVGALGHDKTLETRIARSANEWYRAHNIDAHVVSVLRAIDRCDR